MARSVPAYGLACPGPSIPEGGVNMKIAAWKVIYDRHRARDLSGLTHIRIPADEDTGLDLPHLPVSSQDAPPVGPLFLAPFDAAYIEQELTL